MLQLQRKNMKNINIPEPCSEDWNAMTPSDKGAFCKKCALDVYDFTNKSGDEIREVLTVNIGSRVCGHINKTQLDQLNSDFSSWQMNDKRSFQRAWIFTLFVVFGMTLFSCEEDEEPVVDQFQEIGKTILTESELSSDTLEIETLRGQVCVPENVEVHHVDDIGVNPQDVQSSIKGNMTYEEKVPTTLENKQPLFNYEEEHQDYLIDGGMRMSSDFDEYLLETTYEPGSKDVSAQPEMSGLVYPNPASNQTSLKLNMPNRGKGEIELIGLNGQKIRTIHSGRLKKGENEFHIDLTALETGMYLVVIHSGEMKETIKFTKI